MIKKSKLISAVLVGAALLASPVHADTMGTPKISAMSVHSGLENPVWVAIQSRWERTDIYTLCRARQPGVLGQQGWKEEGENERKQPRTQKALPRLFWRQLEEWSLDKFLSHSDAAEIG